VTCYPLLSKIFKFPQYASLSPPTPSLCPCDQPPGTQATQNYTKSSPKRNKRKAFQSMGALGIRGCATVTADCSCRIWAIISAVCAVCASECLLNSSFSARSLFSSSRISSPPPRPDPRFRFMPALASSPSSSVSAPSGIAPSEVWTRLRCSLRFSCREKPLPVWRLQFKCGQLSCFRGPCSYCQQ
jgi:hypothetical protein